MDFSFVKCLRGESAVGAGHDVFTAHETGETYQPFGDPFRMFNDIACMGNNSGTDDFARRQFHALEQMILVLVAWFCSFKTERACVDLEDVIDDLSQARLVNPRSLVDAIAGVKPYAFRGNSLKGRIRRFDIDFRALPLLAIVQVRLDKNVRQEWIVDLKQNIRGDDCAIFL